MTDIVDRKTRSRMMSGIRGKNTKPEILIRKALHARGFRFRLNVPELPGKPDIVLPRYKAVIMVNGCFWHGHCCELFRLPATNVEFWQAKIDATRTRDAESRLRLEQMGWRVLTVWECALRGKGRIGLETVADLAERWLKSDFESDEILGYQEAP